MSKAIFMPTSCFHRRVVTMPSPATMVDKVMLQKQPIPGAPQRLLQPYGGSDQYGDLASFDLLHRSDIQVGQFRKPLLGDTLGRSFPANIGPESLYISIYLLFFEHAL